MGEFNAGQLNKTNTAYLSGFLFWFVSHKDDACQNLHACQWGHGEDVKQLQQQRDDSTLNSNILHAFSHVHLPISCFHCHVHLQAFWRLQRSSKFVVVDVVQRMPAPDTHLIAHSNYETETKRVLWVLMKLKLKLAMILLLFLLRCCMSAFLLF